MTFNIGVDIEKISRFGQEKSLLAKIFTKKELSGLKKKGLRHIAGIYCAKEAIIKACNPTIKLGFLDIEISKGTDGTPLAVIKKPGKAQIKELKISISHTDEYAAAAAIMMTK